MTKHIRGNYYQMSDLKGRHRRLHRSVPQHSVRAIKGLLDCQLNLVSKFMDLIIFLLQEREGSLSVLLEVKTKGSQLFLAVSPQNVFFFLMFLL